MSFFNETKILGGKLLALSPSWNEPKNKKLSSSEEVKLISRLPRDNMKKNSRGQTVFGCRFRTGFPKERKILQMWELMSSKKSTGLCKKKYRKR